MFESSSDHVYMHRRLVARLRCTVNWNKCCRCSLKHTERKSSLNNYSWLFIWVSVALPTCLVHWAIAILNGNTLTDLLLCEACVTNEFIFIRILESGSISDARTHTHTPSKLFPGHATLLQGQWQNVNE